MSGLGISYHIAQLKMLKKSLSKKTTQALLRHVKKSRLEWGK